MRGHLLRAELRRFRSRRLVVVALLVALAGGAFTAWTMYQSVRPLTGESLVQAQAAYDSEVTRWEATGDAQIADCEEQQQAMRDELDDPTADYGCDQMEPQLRWFFPEAVPLEDSLAQVLGTVAYLLLFVALLAGATGTAADLSSGGTSTWLTFEPRRGRVFTSKLSAIGLSLIAPSLLVAGVALGSMYLLYRNGSLSTAVSQAAWIELAWVGGRTLGLVIVAGLMGAALGFLLRHTGAVLGAFIGYFILVEAVLVNVWDPVKPWAVLVNVRAWLEGGASYFTRVCTSDATGTTCEGVGKTLSAMQGGIYVGSITIVTIALAALVFRRRDIA